jgi:hypothetical protein
MTCWGQARKESFEMVVSRMLSIWTEGMKNEIISIDFIFCLALECDDGDKQSLKI